LREREDGKRTPSYGRWKWSRQGKKRGSKKGSAAIDERPGKGVKRFKREHLKAAQKTIIKREQILIGRVTRAGRTDDKPIGDLGRKVEERRRGCASIGRSAHDS